MTTLAESRKRSVFKTITWRILATTDTFVISWIITGEWTLAGGIASVEIATKMYLYYMHERLWNRKK